MYWDSVWCPVSRCPTENKDRGSIRQSTHGIGFWDWHAIELIGCLSLYWFNTISDHFHWFRRSQENQNANLDRKLKIVKSYNRSSSLEGTGLPTGVLASPIGSEKRRLKRRTLILFQCLVALIHSLASINTCSGMVLQYRRQSRHWEGARTQKMIWDDTAKFPKLFQEFIFTGS